MHLTWTWSNNVLLLGGVFYQTVTSLPHHDRSVELPYAQSSHMVDLQIIPKLHIPRSPGLSHFVHSKSCLNASVNDYSPLLGLHTCYAAFIRIGNQEVMLELDTSSSDTWVADTYFNCLDLSGTNLPQSYCQIGPTFSSNTDCGLREINNTHFNVRYADYNGASGPMAIVPVQVGDNIIVHQQIGIAQNVVTLYGRDNITAGVLGLAYSSLTSSYEGTDSWETDECITAYTNNLPDNETFQTSENACGRQAYTSLSETLFSSNSTKAGNSTLSMGQKMFSLALSRHKVGDLTGGSIVFGGVPDITLPRINATGVSVNVPNEPLNGDPSGELGYHLISVENAIALMPPNGAPDNGTSISTDRDERDLSTNTASRRRQKTTENQGDSAIRRAIQPIQGDISAPITTNLHHEHETVTFKTAAQGIQFKIDSSSPYSYFPAPMPETYSSFFRPPAHRAYPGGPWLLNCSALSYIPPLGVTIGGETFWHNAEDLVVRVMFSGGTEEEEAEAEICYSAIQEVVSGFGDEEGTGDGDATQDSRDVYTDTTYTLGQPFLKNVLAVFDVGMGRIGLVSRVEYETV